MDEKRDKPQPPAGRRRGIYVATKRSVIVIDFADAPFVSRKHLLSLSDQVVGSVISLRYDQFTRVADVSGGRFGAQFRRFFEKSRRVTHPLNLLRVDPNEQA